MTSLNNSSEKIAQTFHDWLEAEIDTSGEDRNKYLDNFGDMRRRITLGYGHEDNWSSQKNIGHLNRLPVWFEAYEQNPVGDEQAEQLSARLLFSPLMLFSGANRFEAYLRAHDKDGYIKLRQRVTGIDLEDSVSSRIREFAPSSGIFSDATLTMEALKDRMRRSIKIGERAVKAVSARLAFGYDLGEQRSRSTDEIHYLQYNWASFATDCVILAAKLRKGELEAVPFLEPRSITDQSGRAHYPFASPVNWTETLAV